TRGDAPERGSGPRRWVDDGDAAERPQQDLVGASANAAAGKRMPEFVHRHDDEDRQVLEHVPDERRVGAGTAADLEDGDEQPAPVDEDGDALELEEPGGAGTAQHSGFLQCSCGERRPGKWRARPELNWRPPA